MPNRQQPGNDEEQRYTDFTNVEAMRHYLAVEQTPEGPYGSPINKDTPVVNKSTPWKPGQRYYSAFNYEFKTLHENLPRKYPGSHPTHDDPDIDEEPTV